MWKWLIVFFSEFEKPAFLYIKFLFSIVLFFFATLSNAIKWGIPIKHSELYFFK